MHFTTVAPPLNQCYPLWEKHALSSAQADPFCCTPAWQLAFHDAFSPRRRLFIVESADATLAFAEKVFPNNSVFLTPIEPHWFFGCPLLGKDALALFAAALDFFASQYQQFRPIFLSAGYARQADLPDNFCACVRIDLRSFFIPGGCRVGFPCWRR